MVNNDPELTLGQYESHEYNVAIKEVYGFTGLAVITFAALEIKLPAMIPLVTVLGCVACIGDSFRRMIRMEMLSIRMSSMSSDERSALRDTPLAQLPPVSKIGRQRQTLDGGH